MAGQNIARLEDIHKERVSRVKEMPCSCQRRQTPNGTLPVGHSLWHILIKRNGLIQDVRASKEYS